jgi:hypothetical protein
MYAFLHGKLSHENHSSGLHHEGGNLGNTEYSETFGGEFFVDAGKGSALAGAGTSSNDDFVYCVLGY